MRYKKALSRFKSFGRFCNYHNGACDHKCGECELIESATIEALEKQIPKKPKRLIFNADGFMTFLCPNCGDFHRSEFEIKFCSDCGQAIGWKEVE